MLAELLEKIEALSVAAKGTHVLHPDAEPKHRYMVVRPNGLVEWQDAAPEPRKHTARSLHTIVEAAEKLKDARVGVRPAVWYSRHGVVLLTDDGDRRDRVTMPLAFSPPLLDLMSREARRQSVSQAQFVSLLRTTLAKTVRGNLLEIVRKVNFVQNAAGNSELQHGKSSIGKSLQSELTGAAIIPEYATFDVPVFAGHFIAVRPVECALEVDAAMQTFTLVPLPLQIEGAVASAEGALGDFLGEALGEEFAVFYGEP